MASTPALPLHLRMELERRPAAARRLGYVINPPSKPAAARPAPPPQGTEQELQVYALERSRRPVAARRLGLVELNTESTGNYKSPRTIFPAQNLSTPRQNHLLFQKYPTVPPACK
eukprot:CAMPEP_0181377548 /NCGR_PEP_ID=MMETSP1106-20121128/17954_1 /TAXON_ID=81844 /ORGANISM="Mantoniella antarctica, Strain SL-175" /LENGTH=114 /DNA_ID=CAMNT_0023496287 /DNA_START=357 /DNA_END=701 /DNA_ORIENTATION=+